MKEFELLNPDGGHGGRKEEGERDVHGGRDIYLQGDPTGDNILLTLIWFPCAPDSAWAAAFLAELAWFVGHKVESPIQGAPYGHGLSFVCLKF